MVTSALSKSPMPHSLKLFSRSQATNPLPPPSPLLLCTLLPVNAVLRCGYHRWKNKSSKREGRVFYGNKKKRVADQRGTTPRATIWIKISFRLARSPRVRPVPRGEYGKFLRSREWFSPKTLPAGCERQGGLIPNLLKELSALLRLHTHKKNRER